MKGTVAIHEDKLGHSLLSVIHDKLSQKKLAQCNDVFAAFDDDDAISPL